MSIIHKWKSVIVYANIVAPGNDDPICGASGLSALVINARYDVCSSASTTLHKHYRDKLVREVMQESNIVMWL